MDITPSQWIIKLLGYNEKELLNRIENGIEIQVNDKYKKVNGGNFDTYTISELNSMVNLGSAIANANTCVNNTKQLPILHIYVRKPGNRSDMYYDTSSLQRIIESDVPPMFQVASNFNCHENASQHTNLFSGQYLTNLMEDSTQGPCASAGAGAGAIKRLEYHHIKPIQLLEFTDATVVNGKLTKVGKDLDLNRIQIGLHTDMTANYDRSEFAKCIFYPEDSPLIDQVFTSTIALDKGRIHQLHQNAMDVLLGAAYAGTYLSAIHRGTKKLVLTMIGGGVFNNPLDRIISSMAHAHVQYAPHSNLEEVILPLYDSRINPNIIIDQLIKQGYPKDHVIVTQK